jgi:HSP20 family protein
MNILPWRDRSTMVPRSELANLFDSMFNDDWFQRDHLSHLPQALRRGGVPAINVAESDKDFTVSAELPGLDEKDIQVQILGNQLVIAGERRWEDEKRDREYHRIESQYGSFRRVIELPEGVAKEADQIEASYSKGVLEIRLPKREPKPAAKIAVKSKEKSK